MPTTAGGTAASEWRVGDLLTRGTASAIPIGAGQTLTSKDVDVGGENEMSVGYEMTGGASADLTVTVVPFAADGVTPMANITIPPQASNGPTFAGGVVQYTGTYDVSGYQKVRVQVKNNNAGAQTINYFWYRFAPN
jgi:hypothetical protein